MARVIPRKCMITVPIITFTVILIATRSNNLRKTTRTVRQAHGRNFSSVKRNDIDTKDLQVISQEDIYVTIKTAGKFHKSRIPLILKTWWNGIKKQAYFFTDVEDATLNNQTDGHVIVTDCGVTHEKYDLCCKMGYEYDGFYDSQKRWWCHFDDDNYVNPSMLLDVLKEYNWTSPMYVGRPSREGDQFRYYKKKKMKLRFATGGGGICITRKLGELMSPWVRNGSFVTTCKDLNQPDDVTFGFVVTNRLGINLTRRNDFNAHTQDLSLIPRESLLSQVVLSYTFGNRDGHRNIVNLTDDVSAFTFKSDRTRMLSYHCMKYPETDWCPRKSQDFDKRQITT